MEIRLVKCGDCFFATGQFNKWESDGYHFSVTDDITDAQIWRGDETVSPEEIAEYVGGRVVTFKEVRDD